jgi:hypothetical protein
MYFWLAVADFQPGQIFQNCDALIGGIAVYVPYCPLLN